MKCWICEKEIEEGAKILEFQYRVGSLCEGQIDFCTNVTPSTIHNTEECKKNALECIRQYWEAFK